MQDLYTLPSSLSPFSPTVASLIIAFLLLCYPYVRTQLERRRLIQKHGCQPPAKYPHKDPFLGLDAIRDAARAAKSKSFLPRVRELYATHGNTFASQFFTSPVINTVEPENIKTVLATNFKDYSIGARRQNAFAPLLGRGIVQVDGPRWEHSRALLRPCFARTHVNDLARYELHVSRLIGIITARGEGQTVDLGALFPRLTVDEATDFLFGDSTDSLLSEDSREAHFAQAMRDAQVGCENRWRMGGFARVIPQPAFYRDVKEVHRYIDSHVERALELRSRLKSAGGKQGFEGSGEEAGRYIFMHELSKVTEDREVLRDELLTLFFAGSDTTAALLSNLFFVLARRPDVWRVLRAEIACLGGAPPTIEQLMGLEYFRFCVNESLRLYPVVPSNSRMAIVDTILPLGGGPSGKSPVFVRAGTMISFPITALHRQKELWGEDAEDFKPERWTGEKGGWKYLPFNGGPRICIGRDFALTSVIYTTARIVQTFRTLESHDPQPWTESLSMTCTSAGGVKIGFTLA